MKTNWQIKKLSNICEVFADGDWIEKKDQSKEGIRLIQTGNVGNSVFKDRSEKARFISEKTFKRLRCTEIFSGDCLISRLPDPVGRACIIPKINEKMITAVDCTILRFKKEILAQWFVNYSLSQEYQNQINEEVGGATRQRISRSNLGLIDIPLPPITEQKRIVKILDEVFEKIEKAKKNAEKNLRNSKALFESYLESIFIKKREDWEEKTIGEVCKIINGGTPDTKVSKYWNGNNFWITPKDMGKIKDVYVNTTIRKISDLGLKNSSAKLLPIDSIILSSRAPIGYLAINKKPMATNQGCKGLITSYKLETLYLFYFLKSSVKLLNDLGSGTTFKELSGSKLAEILIPLPELKDQKDIVKKLDVLSEQTKKLEEIYKKKLADLEELKKSVLKKAFTGQL